MLHQTAKALHQALFQEERLGFVRGVRALFDAVGYLARRPRVLALLVAPWIVNLVVLGPLLYWLMRGVVYPRLIGLLPQEEGFWYSVLQYGVGIPLALLLVGVSLLIFLLAAMLIGAPFHDKAGERIERERLASRPELLAPETPFWAGVRHSLVEALKRVAIGLPFVVLGLSLACIPFVGAPLAFVANWTFAALFLTLDAFSMPMDRRGIPMGGKWSWVRGNFKFALGFGLPMLLMPCAIFLMPPLAAVAASIVYTDVLLEGEKSEPRPLVVRSLGEGGSGSGSSQR